MSTDYPETLTDCYGRVWTKWHHDDFNDGQPRYITPGKLMAIRADDVRKLREPIDIRY
ncbi:hypothetical protein [Streptomyces lavendulae]|uniref:hypothetical protein n=1 Tax=Streptomyces lavendulae TaxID=1914 RepID=UPI0031EE4562